MLEIWKEILSDEKPSARLQALDRAGELNAHPELQALKGVLQHPDHHPEGDVWTHTLMAVDAASEIVRREKMKEATAFLVVLTALCHDLGKPATTKFHPEVNKVRSLGHSEAGVAPAMSFLKRIGADDLTQAKIKRLIIEHLNPVAFYRHKDDLTDRAVQRLLNRLPPATLEELLALSESDQKGRGRTEPWSGFPVKPWLLGRIENLKHESQAS